MKILYYSPTDEVLGELGKRIKALRVSVPLTQQELAEKAGLSKRTISSLESGSDVSFSTVVEVLRVLGKLQILDSLLPEQQIRPSQIVSGGKVRERATKKLKEEADKTGWKWGDEV